MKQSILKRGLLYICIFACLTLLQLGSLVLVALIPTATLQSNMEESADFLCENFVFRQFDSRHSGSIIDRYADSILLNVLYSYDSERPVESVLDASYYYSVDENENFNLYTAVYENAPANKSYSRYWHGSIVLLRPLLVCFNLQQIYVILGIILCLLFLVLLVLICRKLKWTAIIPVLLGGILMSFWYVPFSLEYTWTILLMLITSIIILLLSENQPPTLITIIFLITGSMTAFMDFLSTETLTLLVPLTIYLAITYQKHEITTFRDGFQKLLPMGIGWLVGYAGTWLSKWTIASLVLQENVFASAMAQAGERISGDVEVTGFAKYPATIIQNLNCIWPFNYAETNGYLLVLVLFLVVGIIYFLFRKKSEQSICLLYLLLALVPYIRFIALSNHSFIHYFFTYRTQFATVLCLGIILIYGLDWELIQKECKKLWRKMPWRK
ncbi:MAG: hypothetical protein IJ040_02055 [Lachnospiraceae bacterium]|nr:hypothetical protein [Lachnospiraceae bacterium]